MLELKFCRLCLDDNVRMHQISGSEVQNVYEKLINKKVQEAGRLHYACYMCYRQLKNCQRLVIKSQKSEKLLKQILPIGSEMHLKSISFLDRLTYGLVNSLMVAEINSLQIPNNQNILKIEAQTESDSNEVMVKDKPDDDVGKNAPSHKKNKMGENRNNKQGDVNSIQNEKKQNIFETETNTGPGSNNVSQIVKDEKSVNISGHTPLTINPNVTNIKNWESLCKNKYKIEVKENDSLNKNLRYKCKYCDYTFARKSKLKEHKRIHIGEKHFKCQYCSYTCAQNSRLKIHIRIHTGEKPFKCEYCSYACTRKNDLKIHIRTHTGEKPFKCQYCSYTCAQNSRLKIHIRIHTGEKPFKCEYCSYACTRKNDLKIHIRTHTGEKPFKCQYCSFTCAQKCNLTSHISTHTG